MAYSLALFLHSYLRYIVLATGLVVIVRSAGGLAGKRPFTAADKRAQVAFLAVLDLQLTLGLALYAGLSPITRAFFADPKAGMHDHALRFFGVEHLTAMVLAVAAAHVGRARSKKAPTDEHKHRRALVPMVIWLLLVLVAIPWPGMPYGRPLFR